MKECVFDSHSRKLYIYIIFLFPRSGNEPNYGGFLYIIFDYNTQNYKYLHILFEQPRRFKQSFSLHLFSNHVKSTFTKEKYLPSFRDNE